MYVLTNAQMREADEYTIKNLGVSAFELMERAGRAIADKAQQMAKNGEVLCVCGGGNNGGDGFVCARELKKRGYEVIVVCFAEKKSEQCESNYQAFIKDGGAVEPTFPQRKFALVVDCLLGTGFSGEPRKEYARAIEKINEYKRQGAKILSADIPSGVGDNGISYGVAVRADETVCLGEYKAGAFLNDGIDFSGKVSRVDIGIRLPKNESEYAIKIERERVAKRLPKRRRNTHKGNYGKAAIVAGSAKYSGAAYLSALSCLRAGAGYTALFVPQKLLSAFMLKIPEALLFSINEGDRYAFNEENMRALLNFDAVAFGMGMGASDEVAHGAVWLMENYTGKLILDADALNSLAQYHLDEIEKLFANKKCEVVLTPHIKEFSRLCKKTVQEILSDGLFTHKDFAKKCGCTILLKNAVSLISDGNALAMNVTGTAGQAKGGSGDVLSGVIAGLCAQGLSVFEGAMAGAYLVGKSAEISAQTRGEYSLIATDIIDGLGKAFLALHHE